MKYTVTVFILLATLSCQSSYVRDRGADMADIVDFAVPAQGSALLVQAGIGPLKIGLGHNSTCFYGLLAGRWGTHCINEQNYLFFDQKLEQESLFYDYRFTYRGKRASISMADMQGNEEWTKAGIFLWAIAGINPGEIGDFFAGLFGFDLYDDDYYEFREERTSKTLDLTHKPGGRQ
ncbi:MAG: hypothetical protein CMN76_13020 [Spirochaetaceae bacterium]|nr:hypothetical protein [Spirochaetaceae bacterium]